VLARRDSNPSQPDAIAAIQGWTRQRFKLDPMSAVLVSEVTCRMPGCPPLETVVAFWTEDDRRHQFRLLKPLAEIRYDDIGWLFGTPAAHDPALWSCC
jgi:nitrate reductase delta subunit